MGGECSQGTTSSEREHACGTGKNSEELGRWARVGDVCVCCARRGGGGGVEVGEVQ